jgi:phage-related minor tail protein
MFDRSGILELMYSIVGLGFAVDRLMKGDLIGAALETGSAGLGLLDLVVPGLGTGLSLAADAGIAVRDFKKAGTITPGESNTPKPMATGGIVTGPTRALVGEAGPEAVIPLDKLYAKFDQLIKATQQGKDVSLNLSGFRVQ